MPVFRWERAVQGWLSGRHLGALTVANVAFGGEGVIHLWAPIVVALFAGLPVGAWVGAAFTLALVLEGWLKPLLHRGRPRDPHEDGIPSGDCMAVAVWSPVLLGWWSALPIGLVMWARMARDAHWPLDVIAGAALGLWLVSPALVLR